MTDSLLGTSGTRPELQLEARRAELITAIATAAHAGDAGAVLRAAAQLQELEGVLSRLRDVEADIERVLIGAPLSAVGISGATSRASAKANGARHRAAFLARARHHGVTLMPLQGTIYASPRGLRVGTAVATELHANRWLLGLPDGGCESSALVCITRDGDPIDLCLPKSFLDSVAGLLSRTARQMKLNVLRRAEQMFLKLPHRPPVALDAFVNGYAGLDS